MSNTGEIKLGKEGYLSSTDINNLIEDAKKQLYEYLEIN